MTESDVRVDWYRSAIDRDTLRDLTKRNNWQPLLQNVVQLAFHAATGWFSYWAFHNLAWPWVVLALFVHCTFYGYAGARGHELSHTNMFRTKWINEMFMWINGFLQYFNWVFFRHSHKHHHFYTVHDDLDVEVMLPSNIKWPMWVWALTFDLRFFLEMNKFLVHHSFGRKREYILFREKKRGFYPTKKTIKRMQRVSRAILFGHIALALMFVLTGNWILLFVVTFAPYIARWHVLLTHIPQHSGMKPSIPDWRLNTRTYTAGPISRFFYWNMNYHIEHHMYAAVPYYNLPKLRQAIEGDLPAAAKGLIGAWREMYAAAKRQRIDPEYHIVPELPVTAQPYKLERGLIRTRIG